MANQTKLRYFVYHDGYDPTVLRIGNLVLDYAHPKDHRPYYHEFVDLFGNPAWATKDVRTNCVIIHDHGHTHDFEIGAPDLLNLGLSNDQRTLGRISGEAGSVIELKEPHKFFEKVILKSEKAQKWLQIRLTVANDFPSRVKSVLRPTPKIWLLTGLYLMSNTSQQLVTTNSSGYQASLQVPVPDPSGVLALLQLNVGGSISTNSSEILVTGAEFKQEKVWAAQWQRVRVKKVVNEKWGDALQNQIRLLDTFSLTNVRGPKTTEKNKVVQLDLEDGTEDLESIDETFDEEAWAEFDEEVEELEISLEMEEEDDDNDEEVEE